MFELDLNLKCHIDCKLGQWYHDIWMKSHYSDGWGDMGWHVVRSLSFGDTLHYGLMGAHFVNSAHQIPRDFFYTKKIHSTILKIIVKTSFEAFVKKIVKWRSQVTLYLTIITRLKFMSLFLCPLSKLDPTLSISSANKL